MVAARGVTKTYGDGPAATVALGEATLKVRERELVAVMGASGSGKSTLLRCLSGLETPSSGSVILGGKDLGHMSEARLAQLRREEVGFIFQEFNLLSSLTARENILLPSALAKREVDADLFDAVVAGLDLRDQLQYKPDQLSVGQQQRVACARALVGAPTIIFADEPTGSLDSEQGAKVLRFLAEAVETYGHSVLLATHSPQVAAWADRVVFLKDGETVGEMTQPTHDRLLDTLRPEGARPLERAEPEETIVADEKDELLQPATEEPLPVSPAPVAPVSAPPVVPVSAPPEAPDRPRRPLRDEALSVDAELWVWEESEPLPGSLAGLAPPARLPEDQEEIVTRAQRILADLPGPIADQEP